jgi:hypothetical protein
MEMTMLRDGKFIKEEPIKIGSHYTPCYRPNFFSKEEQFMQAVLLGIEQRRESFLSKVLGLMLRV